MAGEKGTTCQREQRENETCLSPLRTLCFLVANTSGTQETMSPVEE